MTMEQILLGATAVDLAAVLGLGWLVVRGARERALGDATRREALERLRGELQHLIDEADRRARALAGVLGADGARASAVPDGARTAPAGASGGARRRGTAGRPAAPVRLDPSWIDGEGDDDDQLLREALVRDAAADPAELRLRRELELALGTPRQA